MPDSVTDIFAVTAPGLEALAARELRALGVAQCTASRGGVAWKGGPAELYRANLWLRSVSRVLVRMSQFHAASFHELERRARHVPWAQFAGADQPVRFRVTCHKSALYHSDAVAERLARSAVVATGGEANVDSVDDEDAPDSNAQLFVVRVDHDVVSISADSSGALLHRRGYREALAKAPVRETLAAAMLLASEWNPLAPLLDPLCGSGTVAIEAALLARRIAPGIDRSFAFSRWPGFDADLWDELRADGTRGELARAPAPIVASDRDAGAVKATLANAERAGVAADIQLSQRPLSAAQRSGDSSGWVMTNPPYGVRVGVGVDVRNLYARLGHLMRNDLRGWRLGILSASAPLERRLKLDLAQIFETRNGGIKVRFLTTGEGGCGD